ncbi:MAG TPA: ComEC/Rec2 family competence protein [Acidobacteriaceae bacterium]
MRANAGRVQHTAARLSFENVPALFASLFLCVGILVAQEMWLVPGTLLVALIVTAVITSFAAHGSTRVAWVPLACCWFLLGMFLSEIQIAPDAQRHLVWLAENGATHTVEGEVTRTTPVRFEQSTSLYSRTVRQEQSESIDIRIRLVDAKPLAGGLRATLYAPAEGALPALRCGDSVRTTLSMHPPERYLDPGVWDSSQWLLAQGVAVIGSVKAPAIEIVRHAAHGSFFCTLHSLQQAGTRRLQDFADSANNASRLPGWLRLSHEDAGMLGAMILGDRTYLDREARVGFERTGSFHLLVVSGMHLALFAGFIFAFAALLRLPRVWAAAITIAFSFAYALLTGFGDPVQRSFWMVSLFLLARLLYRERNSLNAIGFATLCLIAWNPRAILDASFQMTVLSVLVIAGIVIPLGEHTFTPYLRACQNPDQIALDPTFSPRLAQFRVTLRLLAEHLKPIVGGRAAFSWFPALIGLGLRILEVLLVSSVVELAMSLPMAVYFHRITLLALPVNLLVVPLIAVALPAALIAFASILIAPSLAAIPAAVTAAMLHAIAGIVRLFGSMPGGDLRLPTPGAVAILVSVLSLGFAVWAASNSRFPVSLSIAALACSAACVLTPRPLSYRPGSLEITAIDVGQGDCLLLVFPQGKTLLIDAGGPIGPDATSSSNFEIGEDVVSPVLWTHHIRRLDAVELTHAHSDHMGGMPAILRNFQPKELWVGKNPEGPAYDALLKEAHDSGVRVRSFAAGDSFDFAGTQVQVLSPARDYMPGLVAKNDDSLVIRVAYGHTSVLLEGDAEAASEAHMLSEPLSSDLLKVGHHGSKTSTTPRFLAAVHPTYAIISVGHRNPFGHPRIEVLERLQEDHVLTFRTDAIGATSFYLSGSEITAEPIGLSPRSWLNPPVAKGSSFLKSGSSR